MTYSNETGEAGDCSPTVISAASPTNLTRSNEGDRVGRQMRLAEIKQPTKRAEEKLRESEQYLKTLFNATAGGILVIDPQTHKIVDANPTISKMIGLPRDQVIGHVCHQFVCPAEAGKCPITDLKQKIDTSERVMLNTNGERIPILKSVVTITRQGRQYLLELIIDITERKQTEEALQAEKNKLQSLIDAMEDGLNILDKDYNIIYQNEPLRRLYGDRVGEKCYRVYEGREEICDGCPVKKAFKDGKSHTSERKIIAPSGEVAFWENTANPIRDASGKIVSCLEITRDITERKRMEGELKESEEFNSSLLENSPNPVLVINPDTSVRYVNPAFEQLTGFKLAEILGEKAPFPWWLEEQREEITIAIRKAMALGGTRSEHVFQKKNGERLWVALNSAMIKHQGKPLYFLINWLDITERKQIEEALRHSEKKYKNLAEATSDMIWEANEKRN